CGNENDAQTNELDVAGSGMILRPEATVAAFTAAQPVSGTPREAEQAMALRFFAKCSTFHSDRMIMESSPPTRSRPAPRGPLSACGPAGGAGRWTGRRPIRPDGHAPTVRRRCGRHVGFSGFQGDLAGRATERGLCGQGVGAAMASDRAGDWPVASGRPLPTGP